MQIFHILIFYFSRHKGCSLVQFNLKLARKVVLQKAVVLMLARPSVTLAPNFSLMCQIVTYLPQLLRFLKRLMLLNKEATLNFMLKMLLKRLKWYRRHSMISLRRGKLYSSYMTVGKR